MSKLKMFCLLIVLLLPVMAFSACVTGAYKDCRCSLAANNGFNNVSDVTVDYCCKNGCGGMGYNGDSRCCIGPNQGKTWVDGVCKTPCSSVTCPSGQEKNGQTYQETTGTCCKSSCTNTYSAWSMEDADFARPGKTPTDTCPGNNITSEYTCTSGSRECRDIRVNGTITTSYKVSSDSMRGWYTCDVSRGKWLDTTNIYLSSDYTALGWPSQAPYACAVYYGAIGNDAESICATVCGSSTGKKVCHINPTTSCRSGDTYYPQVALCECNGPRYQERQVKCC